jgi:hypothetical protein
LAVVVDTSASQAGNPLKNGRLVAEAGFEFDEIDQHYMEGAPKFAGFVTRGIAGAVA